MENNNIQNNNGNIQEKNKYYFRSALTEEDIEKLNEIKKENPNFSNNHELFKFLLNLYGKDERESLKELREFEKDYLHELRELKLNQNTLLEVIGELMVNATGFRNSKGIPISDIDMGTDFIGIMQARKKAKGRIEAQQQKNASH